MTLLNLRKLLPTKFLTHDKKVPNKDIFEKYIFIRRYLVDSLVDSLHVWLWKSCLRSTDMDVDIVVETDESG